jgi:hypothetical protein
MALDKKIEGNNILVTLWTPARGALQILTSGYRGYRVCYRRAHYHSYFHRRCSRVSHRGRIRERVAASGSNRCNTPGVLHEAQMVLSFACRR